jgi:hypothetical protein
VLIDLPKNLYARCGRKDFAFIAIIDEPTKNF